MKPNEPSQKSRDIVEAVAEGYSCEEILARDHSLTFHDIFRAATEIPTSFWRKHPTKETVQRESHHTKLPGTTLRHRAD